MKHPGQLFYYVACGRKDGSWPGLHKAINDKIFLDIAEAEEEANRLGKELEMEGKIKVFDSVAYPYEE